MADLAPDFKAASLALNEAGDKDLRNEVYSTFRKIAEPLGVHVIRSGSAELGHRGGLSARVAAAKMSQSNATTGRNPGVALSFRTRASKGGQSYNLKAMDAGVLRHPVFARAGQPRVWRTQSIRAGAFTRPYEAKREPTAREVLQAMERVAEEITRRSSHNTGGPRA